MPLGKFAATAVWAVIASLGLMLDGIRESRSDWANMGFFAAASVFAYTLAVFVLKRQVD